MRAAHHVVASTGVSAVFYATTQSFSGALLCFLSGVLIDLDHIIEFYLLRKHWPSSYQALKDFCLLGKDSKIYLVFHAYELHALLWAWIGFFKPDVAWLGLAIGLSTHLLLDQVFNPIKPLFYFLSYRILNNFDKEKLLSADYFKRQEGGM